MIKENIMTIYKSSARELKKMSISTKNPTTSIPLPTTVIPETVIALFKDLRLVPHELKDREIIVKIPVGVAIITDKKGVEYSGLVESVDPTEVVIHETDSGSLMHIQEYQNLKFEKRFLSRIITLSYLMRGISWKANHSVLIDLKNSKIITFKTVADVINDTGNNFNVTSLNISMSADPQINVPRAPSPAPGQMQMKMQMKRRKESTSSSLQLLSLASETESNDSNNDIRNDANEEADDIVINSDYSGNDNGIEEYDTLDLGPQTIQEKNKFDILNLTNITAEKIFLFDLINRNTKVILAYRFIVPEGAHISSGPITTYNYNSTEKQLGEYLGQGYLSEKFQHDEIELKLIVSTTIRANCVITEEIKEERISREDSCNLDNDQYKYDEIEYDDNDYNKSNQQFIQTESENESDLDYYDDNRKLEIETRVRKPEMRWGGTEDYNILFKVAPKVKVTTIKCKLVNNSNQESDVILKYPVPQEKIISVSQKKYITNKQYKMEFNVFLQPLESINWICKIITKINEKNI